MSGKSGVYSSFRLPLLAGLGLWLIVGIGADPGILGLSAGAFGALLVLGFQRFFPVLAKARHARQLESEIPLALLSLSVFLETGLPIEDGLVRLAKELRGPLGADLRKIAREVEKRNRDWPSALLEWSRQSGSSSLVRTIGQWIVFSKWGDSKQAAEVLRQLARDLLDIERSRVRALSSRMAMGSILLVVVMAVIPALFLSFALLASQVLSFSISAAEVQAIVLAGFPGLALGIAVLMWGPSYFSWGGMGT